MTKSSEDASAKREFTFRQRLALWLISSFGTLAIRLIGPTLRVIASSEDGQFAGPQHAIYAFWHQCVFASAWQFRNHGIAVMTSRSFDGEYIARIIKNLGYRAVRGSSSSGAVGALMGMQDELQQGHPVAFTIDGPRGPRFVAKPGPILLAKISQKPVMCYHLAAQRKWVLNSWDQTQIPKPFSHACFRLSAPIHVPADADDQTMELKHAEMQAALDRVREFAEQQARAR